MWRRSSGGCIIDESSSWPVVCPEMKDVVATLSAMHARLAIGPFPLVTGCTVPEK